MDMPTPYRLAEHLSFCEVDGHAVFLDLAGDRYFRLPPGLERDFIAYVQGDATSASRLDALVSHGILVRSDLPVAPACAAVPRPLESAIEQPADARPLLAATILELAALTWSTRRRLRHFPLLDVLTSLVSNRPDAGADNRFELASAALQFARARRYVPIEPVCLLDSVTLLRFLVRRKLHAHIVFGVTYDPFAAHCWVQSGDLVLNDTVGNTGVYMPIRRV